MLASLKHALQGDRNPAEEKLSSRKKITAILHQLKADHELLSVVVPGCRDNSNSAILGVREDTGHFYLDELSSPAAHEAFLKKRNARIHGRLQGMELSFSGRMLKAGNDGGIALYKLAIPKSILRLQRRDNFRLRLSPGLQVPLTIPHFQGQSVSGEAFDLSGSGLGALLRTREIPGPGKIIPGLSLSLPGYGPLQTSVEIRFARLDSARQMLRIGARFVKLERKQERLIAQFIAEQQRKRRRHEPR